MVIALNIALGLVGLLWLLTAIGSLRAVLRLPVPVPLGSIGPEELAGEFVSIIIAARDEAERIEETVRCALAQEGVRFEVIAVDDRSTDGTRESLDAMATADPALRVVPLTELPGGWLGKCHALERGSEIARGGWLLFLDADTHLAPGAVAGALAQGLRGGVEHVTMLPDLVRPTFWGQVALWSFWGQMADRAMKVNRDHPRLFMGIGAFNMIKRETYRRIGGHARLRLQVIDDMVLGLCVRKVGARTRVLMGMDAAQVEYGSDLPSVIGLFEKNGYAAINFNGALLLAMPPLIVIVIGGALGGPLLAVWPGAWAGWFAFVAFASSAAPAALMARRRDAGILAALLTPIGHCFFMYAILRSAAITIGRGGIVWRETFYPLKDLKAARLSWRVKTPLPGLE
jgi:hypothetical protein